MGQSKGQAASLEQQLRRMKQARQPRPPKAPQAQKKGLPRLERMDTSDSLTEMDTRNSFTTTTIPLSTHPASSKSRSKSRKSVAAPPPPPPHKLAPSAKGGVKPVGVPPPPPQKHADPHAVAAFMDELATTFKSVADGRTEYFGIESFVPPRRNEVDDDFDAQMRDLHIDPSEEDVRLWETQFRLWRGRVHKDASSTTIDVSASTNVAVHREVLISAVRKMGEHVREHVREDHHHRTLAKELLTDFMSVATMDRGEIYFVLDDPAKPTTTTTRASPMKQVNREAVRVLQALVRRCGGAVKQPPASKRRRRPRRRPKKDNSLKRALAKGRAADALADTL